MRAVQHVFAGDYGTEDKGAEKSSGIHTYAIFKADIPTGVIDIDEKTLTYNKYVSIHYSICRLLKKNSRQAKYISRLNDALKPNLNATVNENPKAAVWLVLVHFSNCPFTI